MAITREDVLGWIEGASILDINELVKELEEKFGITAMAAPVASGRRRWRRRRSGSG